MLHVNDHINAVAYIEEVNRNMETDDMMMRDGVYGTKDDNTIPRPNAMHPPAGYFKIAEGSSCSCNAMWTGPDGRKWCCGDTPTKKIHPDDTAKSNHPPRVDTIVEAVRADLLQRSRLGIAKYGTTLNENHGDLRAWLQHAYEECLDQANYLKCAIQTIDNGSTATPPVMKYPNPQLGIMLTNLLTLANDAKFKLQPTHVTFDTIIDYINRIMKEAQS